MAMRTIAVVGGGAWGTALAQVAASAGAAVTLWAREADVVTAINQRHRNDVFLKDVVLSPAVRATQDMAALAGVQAILLVAPAQFLRPVLGDVLAALPDPAPLVLCAKGIEQDSGLLLTEVAAQIAPQWPLAVLSGPTFASEVARGLPTAITLACADTALGERLVDWLGGPAFRPYLSDDLIGAEVGGAVKNVLAIACGIAHGRALGENARAALITRGFAEMVRFGEAKGARRDTLRGLCGLGDLILTCSSLQSRNMSLGAAIGQGRSMHDVLAERQTVAEGAYTAPVLLRSAQALGVDMPITEAVVDILYHGADVGARIAALLARPYRAEQD